MRLSWKVFEKSRFDESRVASKIFEIVKNDGEISQNLKASKKVKGKKE